MAEKIPKKLKRSVRYVALETIERVDKGGAYSNLLLNEMMTKIRTKRERWPLVYRTCLRHN